MFARIIKVLVYIGFVLCVLVCVILASTVMDSSKSLDVLIVGTIVGTIIGIIIFAFIGAMAEMACDIRDIKKMMRKYISNQSVDFNEKEENKVKKELMDNDADENNDDLYQEQPKTDKMNNIKMIRFSLKSDLYKTKKKILIITVITLASCVIVVAFLTIRSFVGFIQFKSEIKEENYRDAKNVLNECKVRNILFEEQVDKILINEMLKMSGMFDESDFYDISERQQKEFKAYVDMLSDVNHSCFEKNGNIMYNNCDEFGDYCDKLNVDSELIDSTEKYLNKMLVVYDKIAAASIKTSFDSALKDEYAYDCAINYGYYSGYLDEKRKYATYTLSIRTATDLDSSIPLEKEMADALQDLASPRSEIGKKDEGVYTLSWSVVNDKISNIRYGTNTLGDSNSDVMCN